MKKEKITQEILKRHLRYSKTTGVFRWIKSGRGHKLGVAGSVIDDRGRIKITLLGHTNYAHRLAFLYVKGYLPENLVDHIDTDPTNNRFDNLREVSSSCNMRNCRVYKNSVSGVTGVIYVKKYYKGKCWAANIWTGGKQKQLGSFKSIDDAILTRHKAEVKYGYSNCLTTSSAYLYLKKNGLVK